MWPLTHVGKYQGEIVAANILGEPRTANYEAVPRVVFTDPQAASVGAADGRFSATAAVSEVSKTATYTRAYAESNGFMTLVSDGERLIGWQQATLAIRARVPLGRAARHDPALPHLLRDLRRRVESPPRRTRASGPARRGGIAMNEFITGPDTPPRSSEAAEAVRDPIGAARRRPRGRCSPEGTGSGTHAPTRYHGCPLPVPDVQAAS
jgi:hypothetical protein